MTVNVFFLIVFMAVNLLKSTENKPDIKVSNRTLEVSFLTNPFEFTSRVEIPLKNLARQKRSLIELYNMVSCTTRCNPLAYTGYGCYCGFLGSGDPVDEIDRCCKQHDDCYGRSKCYFPFYYIVQYNWKCTNGIPYCVNGWNQGGSCSEDLCECDRRLAECLRDTSCPSSKVQCYTRWLW